MRTNNNNLRVDKKLRKRAALLTGPEAQEWLRQNDASRPAIPPKLEPNLSFYKSKRRGKPYKKRAEPRTDYELLAVAKTDAMEAKRFLVMVKKQRRWASH